MKCFHVTTPGGLDVRINGDPDMAPETLDALMHMFDLAYAQLSRERLRPLAYELAGIAAERLGLDADAEQTEKIARALESGLQSILEELDK